MFFMILLLMELSPFVGQCHYPPDLSLNLPSSWRHSLVHLTRSDPSFFYMHIHSILLLLHSVYNSNNVSNSWLTLFNFYLLPHLAFRLQGKYSIRIRQRTDIQKLHNTSKMPLTTTEAWKLKKSKRTTTKPLSSAYKIGQLLSGLRSLLHLSELEFLFLWNTKKAWSYNLWGAYQIQLLFLNP